MSQPIVPRAVTDWLKTRDNVGDKLLQRRAIIDLCDGDHMAAMIFNQLLYYHLPDKTAAGTKLRVRKDGALWVAKKHTDWQEECRINEHTARKKINWLKRTGLVRTQNFMFNGLKVLHLRIDFECMAARLAALDPVDTIRPERSDQERYTGTDRYVLTGRTDLTPPGEPITETTTQHTDKESTPQPSPDGEGAFFISPGLNLPGEEAHASGGNNWLSRTIRDDRAAAEAVSQLFPADPNSPLVSKDVARKFVKRRSNILGGNAALLLAKMFHHARFEGTVVPEWKHCRTYSALLEVKNLKDALKACREAAKENLDEVNTIIDNTTDITPAIQFMPFLDDEIIEGTDLVRFCTNRTDITLCCSVAFRKQHPYLGEVQREYADAIKEQLTRELFWSQKHGGHFAEVFGVDEDEIKLAQESYIASLRTRKAEMEMLLR